MGDKMNKGDLGNEICQNLEDLHNSVNQYFQMANVILQNRTRVDLFEDPY